MKDRIAREEICSIKDKLFRLIIRECPRCGHRTMQERIDYTHEQFCYSLCLNANPPAETVCLNCGKRLVVIHEIVESTKVGEIIETNRK